MDPAADFFYSKMHLQANTKSRLWGCAIGSALLITSMFVWRSKSVKSTSLLLAGTLAASVSLLIATFNMDENTSRYCVPWMAFTAEPPIGESLLAILALTQWFKLTNLSTRTFLNIGCGLMLLQFILLGAVFQPKHFNDSLQLSDDKRLAFIYSADVNMLCNGLFFTRVMLWLTDSQTAVWMMFAQISNYALFKMTMMREFRFAFFIAHVLFPVVFAAIYILHKDEEDENDEVGDKKEKSPMVRVYPDNVMYIMLC
jgi:hypothetical protein